MNGLKFYTLSYTVIRLKKIGHPDPIHIFSQINEEDIRELVYNSQPYMLWILTRSSTLTLSGSTNTFSKDQTEEDVESGNDDKNYYQFEFEGGNVQLVGHINSLINNSNIIAPYTFFKLFKDCRNLVSINGLQLNFLNGLADGCYMEMFEGCTGLTNVGFTLNSPLAPYCYCWMFKDCTNLRSLPTLAQTTLVETCYFGMFMGCTSLTTVAENYLQATEMARGCYVNMFSGCTSLTACPNLPLTNLTLDCYMTMFAVCTSLQTAPLLPALDLAPHCYYGMFSGCTGLKQAPELPATGLTDSCYNRMFANCTLLTSTPDLPATICVDGCYSSMFENCSKLTYINPISATTVAKDCYNNMFANCTSLTDISYLALPAKDLARCCYFQMFSGCTALTAAPSALPASGLAKYCYSQMFRGCTSLDHLYIDTCVCDDHGALSVIDKNIVDWLKDTAPVGTFYGLKDCYDSIYTEIPSGWEFIDVTPLIIKAGTNTADLKISIEKTDNLPYLSTLFYKFEGELLWLLVTSSTIIELEDNDIIKFKNVSNTFSYSNTKFYRFKIEGVGDIEISGNLRALNNFDYDLTTPYQFTRLFEDNDNIVSVSGLDVTFNKLQKSCFARMFANCINLENIPTLKNKLAERCYKQMFKDCISIHQPVVTLEKTLAPFCYEGMFEGCLWIPSADLTKAVNLSVGCFKDIFYKCNNLTDIKVNFEDWNSFRYTDLWLTDTAYFGNFTKPELLDKKDSPIPLKWNIDILEYAEEESETLSTLTEKYSKHKTYPGHEEEDVYWDMDLTDDTNRSDYDDYDDPTTAP